jgi:hypothetical protein
MKKLFSFLLIVFLISCSKDPVIYTLTATANPSEGGTVSPSTQQYDSGDVATVTATASSEYVFQSWSGSASGSSPSTTVTMDSDKAVVANFVKKKYALTVNVEGEGSVTEKVIKAGVATDYNSGTVVELTAVPEEEWLFVEWKGDLTGSENPKEITIDKAKTVTAVFVKKQYPLTIEIEGEGTVTEEVIKQGLATDYNSGTIVELTAVPTGDWEFVEWSGDITSTENPVQITIDGPKTVKAKFMRYFNYKVPSHDWKRDIIPWLNFESISSSNNFNYEISSTATGFGDFNRDGHIDFMTQNVPSQTEWNMFLWDDNQFIIDNSLISNPEFQVTTGARKTVTNDFNGDNLPDIIRIDGGHDVLGYTNILLSKSDGSYELKNINEVPFTQYHGFASGDIDNDGDVDLFFGQPKSGFAINDGNANFNWYGVHERINNYFKDVTEQDGPYGAGTVEIIDVNNDGNLDLVVGGTYKDASYDQNLTAPTILWGDGSGNFDYNNKTEVWKLGEKPSYNGKKVDNNDDIVIGDIDGDGINDIVLLYIFQIDNDPNNNGNTTMYYQYQIMKNNNNESFSDVTDNWLPDSIKYCTVVWTILKDVDKNGRVDLTEYASTTSKVGDPNGNCPEKSMEMGMEWIKI